MMGSFHGNCEIVEVENEHASFNQLKGNHEPRGIVTERKSSGLEKGSRSFMEDDINKLFESFSLRNSPKSLDISEQGSRGFYSKNALKRPMRQGISPPGIGFSEPVSLKQALRGLCIAQASEMAAMKHSTKTSRSPSVSEAGKTASLYRSVVVEAGESGLPLIQGRKGRLEISLFPEEDNPVSSGKMSCEVQKSEQRSVTSIAHSSPRANPNSKVMESIPKKNEEVSTHNKDKNQSSMIEQVCPKEEEKHISLPSLPSHNANDYGNSNKGNSSLIELSDIQIKSTSSSSKLTNKTTRLRRKAKLQSLPSPSSVVSKSRRNVPRVTKSVTRSRSLPKKKVKQEKVFVTSSSAASNDVKGSFDHNADRLICQRCQCTLRDVIKVSDHDSFSPISATATAEVSSSYGNFGAIKPGPTLSGCDNGSTVVKNNLHMRHRDKGEYSQSSKSSMGEYSSSTSLSEESNISGSSCGNRPHMSKDFRWQAIDQVSKQHGFLGLRHFNLLKKLGCGDIGTVYLAELIGKKCLFAIKVMDNEYLARRKKISRAQTEKEILRMLDHPFLPTLYAHFVSDNLSCFVMEYCPGGDLHVLRQRQAGRYYPEPSARFYVAEVLLALEYLHMLGIVYRDLKPENILVREDGHIMLTDFDLSLQCSVRPTLLKSSTSSMEPPRISGPCKGSGCIDPFCAEPTCQVSCFSPRIFPPGANTRKQKAKATAQVRSLPQLVAEPTDARSNSFVGTHEYLAPEIIKGTGHGSAVDWWTLGIFLYELLYGKTPFKGSGNEETLANVVLQNLRFPDTPVVSFQARDLIRGLLEKEPENRLGYEKGAAEVKQHPFFIGLNWALIRCAVPPQIPEYCDVGVTKLVSQEKGGKYFEYGATGEHLEFELF